MRLTAIILLSFAIISAETIVLDRTPENYVFDRIILQSSLEIKTSERVLIRDEDYSFSRGIVIFFNPGPDSLIINFMPSGINRPYASRLYTPAADSVINEPPVESFSDIRIIGMKGFSLNAGNSSDITLDQSMELSIEGRLTDTWNISGYIYDNSANAYTGTFNAPINRIENIRISMYDTVNSITFGNTDFSAGTGYYARQREIIGIKGNTSVKGYNVLAAVAGQKGKYSSTEFFCLDNIQGPYSLTDAASFFGYVIAPGSENIYLNGELLVQGEDMDYTIDYNSGDIFFTASRPVNSSSYVYAEFQTYEQENPVTGIYACAGSDSSRLRAVFIREEQSVSDKDILNSISGMSSDSGYVFVNTYIYSPSEGDYILVDSVFVFTGAGNGDYLVSFSYTGYGKGDYAYNPSTGGFVYAGSGLGSYMPGRRVDLPFESDFLALSYTLPVLKGYIRAETGGGFYKTNRYNSYEAYQKDLSYNIDYLTGDIYTGPVTWSARLARTFMPGLYRRVWNEDDNASVNLLSETGLNGYGQRNIAEFTGRLGKSFLRASGSMTDSLKDIRSEFRMDSVFGIIAGISKKYSFINDSTVYDFTDIYGGGYLPFGTALYSKQWEYRLARSYDRHILTLKQKEAVYNIKFAKESAEGDNYNTITYSGALNTGFYIGAYSFRSNIDLSRINDVVSNSTDNRILGRLAVNNSSGSFIQSHNLSLSSVSQFIVIENYLLVGKGEGQYIYDSISGTYIEDPYEGEYVLVEEMAYTEDPAAKRDYTFTGSYNGNDISSQVNLRYSDNATDVFSLQNGIISGSTFASLYADYSHLSIVPFTDWQYNFTTSTYNTLYRKWAGKLGVRMPHAESSYFLTAKLENEDRVITGTLDETYRTIEAESEVERNMKSFTYSVNLLYQKVTGTYEDRNYTDYSVLIDKTSLGTEMLTRFSKGFSVSVMPQASFCIHNSSDIPLSIYYRYPQGLSFNGQVFLNWTNNIINAGLRYVFEYTGRFKVRNRLEMSLYTYF